jgi:hypothetical protein
VHSSALLRAAPEGERPGALGSREHLCAKQKQKMIGITAKETADEKNE